MAHADDAIAHVSCSSMVALHTLLSRIKCVASCNVTFSPYSPPLSCQSTDSLVFPFFWLHVRRRCMLFWGIVNPSSGSDVQNIATDCFIYYSASDTWSVEHFLNSYSAYSRDSLYFRQACHLKYSKSLFLPLSKRPHLPSTQ